MWRFPAALQAASECGALLVKMVGIWCILSIHHAVSSRQRMGQPWRVRKAFAMKTGPVAAMGEGLAVEVGVR